MSLIKNRCCCVTMIAVLSLILLATILGVVIML
ncbi:unnamed protein product, partial [Rotaria sp. Silwood1]